MSERDGDWAATQTVAPVDVKAHPIAPIAIELSWAPIPYTGNGGFYEVRCGTTSGGPYAFIGTTADTGGKTAARFIVAGLTPTTPYFCVVRTFTPRHGPQQNDLISLDSAEVSATPDQVLHLPWVNYRREWLN